MKTAFFSLYPALWRGSYFRAVQDAADDQYHPNVVFPNFFKLINGCELGEQKRADQPNQYPGYQVCGDTNLGLRDQEAIVVSPIAILFRHSGFGETTNTGIFAYEIPDIHCAASGMKLIGGS